MAKRPLLTNMAAIFLTFILLFTTDVITASDLRTCLWKRLAGDVVSASFAIDTSLVAATFKACTSLCFQRSVCEGFCYNVTTSRCYVINTAASTTATSVPLVGEMQCYALAGQCPYSQGYSLRGCRCIKFYDTFINYYNATARCAQDGAHLYHLKSLVVDRQPYFDLLTANGWNTNGNYWVGADDLLTSRQFRWTDGTPLPAGAREWRAGEPNNVDERCVIMATSFLLDVACGTRMHPFACQIDV